jgi:hypothetical protein
MKLRPLVLAAATALVPALLTGCPEKGMTLEEAGQALDEVGIEAQAQALTNGTIEISTNFTIGQAVEAAAEELKTFVETQLPCAEITLANSTLTIEYGVKPGNCVYRGQTYSGKHAVTVDHAWTEMKNQTVSVTGSAHVTWNFQDPARHVVHDLEWTRLSDGRKGVGTGDVVQKPLPGGLIEGFSTDGEHGWDGQSGSWDLAINQIEMRWVDPIPQAGSYELTSPEGKTATLSFSRVDEDSIEAKFETGKDEWVFVVNKLGYVEEKGEGK